MEPSVYYAIGSGTTCAAVMAQLGLENTLLGIDLVKDGELIAKDVTAQDLLSIVEQGHRLEVFITLIGGQGHIIGRGNQQISPALIRCIGWDKIHVIATKTKLKSLEGRPLIVDSGDAQLDESLTGTKKVITGYHDAVLYRVGLDYSLASS
jgi:predicted polyphosphate/ATP-dependent NAD kinase